MALTCLDPISHTGIELRSQDLVEGIGAVEQWPRLGSFLRLGLAWDILASTVG